MGELFENFKDVDIPAVRKKAQEQGWKKGHIEGIAEGIAKGRTEGLAEGHAKGETRLAKLVQTLMQDNRMDDLTKVLSDSAYRNKLYQQYNIYS